MKIEDRHWRIWAMLSRQTPGREVGFPSQEPWYTPQGPWRDHGERDEIGNVTPDDELIAESIGRAVNELGQWQPKWRLALMVWWKAYPGAKSDCHERCRQKRISWGLVYNRRDEARSWCEAHVYFTSGFAVGM